MLKAGRLDRLVTLETNTPAANAYGEFIDVWGNAKDVWANVQYQNTKEIFHADQLTALQTVVFTIRYRSGVTAAKSRIIHDGQIYDITGVSEIGRREGLKLIGIANADAVLTVLPDPVKNATATAISDTEILLEWENG